MEHHKVRPLGPVGDVLNAHIESGVRLIGAVASHGVRIGHARQWSGNVNAYGLCHQGLNKAFGHLHNVLAVHKAHFQVDLGKLRLPVGAQVLISKAAGQLNVTVQPGDHAQLFVDLGALGQGIELALVYPGRHYIVPGALRGGFDQHGGLDLYKIVAVEIFPGNLGDFVAHEQVPGEPLVAQVQVAVFQRGLVAYFICVGDFKGRGLRLGKHAQVCDRQLNLAGFQLFVDALPLLQGAGGSQHILAAYALRLGKNLSIGGVVKAQLQNTGAVPQVNKDQVAQVPLALCPAVNGHFLPDLLGGEVAAVVCSFHSR